jgi:hypothetical protein
MRWNCWTVAPSTSHRLADGIGLAGRMKLKLIFVDSDTMNCRKVVGEEFMEGESEKPLTKNRVLKMVKRFHPELRISGVIDVSRFQEDSALHVDWLVHFEQLGSNLWRYIYAARVQDESPDYRAPPESTGETGTSDEE